MSSTFILNPPVCYTCNPFDFAHSDVWNPIVERMTLKRVLMPEYNHHLSVETYGVDADGDPLGSIYNNREITEMWVGLHYEMYEEGIEFDNPQQDFMVFHFQCTTCDAQVSIERGCV